MTAVRKHSTQFLISAILLVALASVFYVSKYLKNAQNISDKPVVKITSYCQTVVGCSAILDGNEVTLHISPPGLPAAQPLDISVSISGLAAENVTMEFIGRDMHMGLMPFVLQELPPTDIGTKTFMGVSSVSFCTVDNTMIWTAELKIETANAIHSVLFELDTSKEEVSDAKTTS
ncbi:hypothetical protein [Endozoicomonas ascidiicola]|uniref:hypothetical protein n=1 Tax=Endozoicomonas ascidiicola TaxID=1698521 RepID=UPI000A3F9F75|nr:hypothetical protein [Endozoicomonas ascidiicola]